MPAAGEDLLPPVEGGQLLFEEDVPAFGEAEPALFGGGVVPTGGGQDGPGDLVGDPLVLELPDMCTQGGPLLLVFKIDVRSLLDVCGFALPPKCQVDIQF